MDDDLDTESLSPLKAYEAVRRFAQSQGALPLRLALHAALPQVLHADLLHLLRLNFVDDGHDNPVTEADVLFAAFCNDLGHRYFRFDAHARSQLLAELDACYAEERPHRSQQVAEFLLQHFERELEGVRTGTDAMYRSWVEVERWNALAYADPDAAAEQLAQVLHNATEPDQAAARLRVGTLAQTLAQPLMQHPRLLAYAAVVKALQADSTETAQAMARRLGDDPVQVGTVVLQPVGELVKTAGKTVVTPSDAAPEVAPTTPPKTKIEDESDRGDAKPADKNPGGEPAAPPPAHERAPPAIQDCEYTAYISYALADDVAWFDWTRHFRDELARGIAATLRGQRLPPLHLSGDSGTPSAAASEDLQARISRSFALVVVVHDHYVDSPWCLKELETFHQLYGEAGLRERLYVVALSEPAMRRLKSHAKWTRLMGGGELVWMPFYDEADPSQPIDVYLAPGLVSSQFRVPFQRLLGDLAKKVRASIEAGDAWEVPPGTVLSVVPQSELETGRATGRLTPSPQIYIESNHHERVLWEAIGQQLQERWEAIVRTVGVMGAPLRYSNLPIDRLNDMPDLHTADGVMLLWGKKSGKALVSQINSVEQKITAGRGIVPGVVLYLMPPNQTSEPVPAWGWHVLRWRIKETPNSPSTYAGSGVVEEEDQALDQFLHRVLEHWQRRSTDSALGSGAPEPPPDDSPLMAQ